MNERQQSIVKILEKHVADMNNEFDTLDRKAQQNIAVSSIVAAVVGAFKLNEVLPFRADDPALLFIFLVYGIAFLLSLVALSPQSWKTAPLDPSKENVTKVEAKGDTEYYQWLTQSYLYIIKKNQAVLTRKGQLVRWGIVCLLIDVALIAYAALS